MSTRDANANPEGVMTRLLFASRAATTGWVLKTTFCCAPPGCVVNASCVAAAWLIVMSTVVTAAAVTVTGNVRVGSVAAEAVRV